MSNENNIEFQVRIKREGTAEAAKDLEQLEAGAKSLAETSKDTGAALDKMTEGAKDAGAGMEAAGYTADQAGAEIKDLAETSKGAGSSLGKMTEGAKDAGAGIEAVGHAADQAGTEIKGLGETSKGAESSLDKIAKGAKDAGAGMEAAAHAADQAGAEIKDLAGNSNETGTALTEMAGGAKDAGDGLHEAEKSAKKTQTEFENLRTEIDAKSAAIKASLELEKSEIELANKQLIANRATQQAALQAAQAKGDEAAATRAQNALRQIESDQLRLVAQAKRAESTAIRQAAIARREELAAVGPLTEAKDKELRAAENLARALNVEAAAAETASQRAKALRNAHDEGSQATEKLSGRVNTLKDLLGQMATTVAMGFGFRELVAAAAEMEKLRSGLAAISQDAALAGKQLEFVRAVANRIGADVQEVGRAFLGLTASTKGTAVEGEKTRQVFEAVATAMGKAGKGSAETGNALLALSQMASKGVVQAEELKGQLGEALPGALQAAAKGLGITTEELIKLVEQGKITAEDLFPALTKGLNELYGGAPAAQTLSQEITNIKNAFTDMADNIGQNGGLDALKAGAEIAQAAIVTLDIALVSAGKSIGVLAAAVANWDFSQLKQSFADIENEARDKLLKAAQHNEKLRTAIELAGTEATKAALAQQQQALAAEKSGNAAAKAGDDFVRMANGYTKVLESIRELIAEQEKSVAARDAEGKAAVSQAAAFGTEAEQRRAQAQATAAMADETLKLAQLKREELDTLKEQLNSLRDEAKAHGEVSKERAQQLADLEKQIGLRQQDADKAVAQAQSARLAAEAAKVEAEAQKDNSARVKELADAYDLARQKVEQVKAAKDAGKASTEDLTKAEIEAGSAARLYRDALDDQVRALEAKTRAQQADISLSTSGLQLELAQERAKEASARAEGRLADATDAKIRQKQIEIKIIEATVKAQQIEAEGAIAVAKAKLAELDVTDKGNAVKRIELETAIKLAQARINQAKATGESTKLLQADIDALRNGTNVHRSAAQAIDLTTSAMMRANAERERAIALQERENDLLTRELQLQEAKRKAGTISGVDAVPAFESQAQADAWLAKWREQYQSDNPFSTNSSGALGNFGYDMTMFEWSKEVRAMELRNTMKGNGNAETSSKTPLEAMASRQISTINLQLNGQPYGQVNTDPAGAASLNQFLGELSRQKGASSS